MQFLTESLYVVYDEKAENHTQPATYANDAVACRNCEQMASDPDHLFGASPTDFSLWKVGNYDSQSGIIEAHPPKHIANFVDLVRQTDAFDPTQTALAMQEISN